MSDPIKLEKAALRAQFKAYRAGLRTDDYVQRSTAIVSRARQLPALARAEVVHVYWPLVHQREVDTRPLISWLHAEKKQIALPVVLTFETGDSGSDRLAHRRFAGEASMRPNRWDILEPEPSGADPVSLEQVDLIVVPALGAGRNGHRIGHGYGFYDELLRSLSVPSVCLVYAACLVDRVPAEAHDAPVSVIVTEHEVFYPNMP